MLAPRRATPANHVFSTCCSCRVQDGITLEGQRYPPTSPCMSLHMPMIGKCCCDWQGREKVCPSLPESTGQMIDILSSLESSTSWECLDKSQYKPRPVWFSDPVVCITAPLWRQISLTMELYVRICFHDFNGFSFTYLQGQGRCGSWA